MGFALLLAGRLQLVAAGDHLDEIHAEDEFRDQIDRHQQNDGPEAEAAAPTAHRDLEAATTSTTRETEAAAATLATAILYVVAGPFIIEFHFVSASLSDSPGSTPPGRGTG